MESMDKRLKEIKNNTSCVHLKSIPEDERNTIDYSYQLVISFFVTVSVDNAFNRKAQDAHCTICNAANKRLHACLQCAFFGCFDPYEKNKSHMKDHAEENDHYFAINFNLGFVYCFQCDDYIYDETLDYILNCCRKEAVKKNIRKTCVSWMPDTHEMALIKNKVIAISTNSVNGLRGIVNIGNSCYINCLIQVFVHNPLIRKICFKQGHKCFKKPPDTCLTCELYNLVREFYSGVQIHYNPMKFLGALQKFSAALLGVQQDDSYLLYQELLQGLLNSCQEVHEPDECNCTIHEMFYGIIENNIKCAHCEKSSLLPDEHFVDIMLDLKDRTDTIKKILERRFCNPEPLIDYTCSGCNTCNSSSSSQIIRKLPTVICFRLNCVSEQLTKKSTAFNFEDWLEMAPYSKSNGDTKFPTIYKYYLFGIVFHRGRTLDQGHYSVYVRQFKDRWYECNDASVYQRSTEEVFKVEPFLLFYYKFF